VVVSADEGSRSIRGALQALEDDVNDLGLTLDVEEVTPEEVNPEEVDEPKLPPPRISIAPKLSRFRGLKISVGRSRPIDALPKLDISSGSEQSEESHGTFATCVKQIHPNLMTRCDNILAKFYLHRRAQINVASFLLWGSYAAFILTDGRSAVAMTNADSSQQDSSDMDDEDTEFRDFLTEHYDDAHNDGHFPHDVDIAVLYGPYDERLALFVTNAREGFQKYLNGHSDDVNDAQYEENANDQEKHGAIQPIRVDLDSENHVKFDFHGEGYNMELGYCECQGLPLPVPSALSRVYKDLYRPRDGRKLNALSLLVMALKKDKLICPSKCQHKNYSVAEKTLLIQPPLLFLHSDDSLGGQ